MLRDLTTADLPALLQLGREMHAEGVYAAYPMDEARVEFILNRLLPLPDVLTIGYEIRGELVGLFIGEVIQDLWVDVLVAVNQMVYVRRSARSSRAGYALLHAYSEWAEARGADAMSFSVYAGINNDAVGRALKELGYAAAGGTFKREVHHG